MYDVMIDSSSSSPHFSRTGLMYRVLAGLSLMACGCLSAVADDLSDRLDDDIRPMIAKYCLDCHAADSPEADLDLSLYRSLASVREDRPHWLKVIAQLRTQSMPPEDSDQPTADERARFIEWADTAVNSVDCSGPVSPGRVTLRRLNRFEYRYTVLDWLGVDFVDAEGFPGDDVGYGFDNIGDVMSLPPLLMEKYLAAAERVSRDAIVTPAWPPELVRKLTGSDLRGYGTVVGGATRALVSRGEAFAEVQFPADGLYEVRVTATGDQAGDEPVRMAIRLDDQAVVEHAIKAARPAEQVIRRFLQVRRGKHRLGLAFVNDYYQPQPKGGGDRNLHLIGIHVRGPLNPRPSELSDRHRRIVVAWPNPQQTLGEAARLVLAPLASRAYRRPVRPDELKRLVRLVEMVDEKGDSFEAGVRLALQAILISPHFLFRVEADPEGSAEVRTLNDYELATRLSYFLWSSLPDDELMELASAGQLHEDGQIQQQVKRMLEDPKGQRFVERFSGQWLQLASLEDLTFDAEQFPDCDAELLGAMRRETELFFGAMVGQDLSVLELLDADFTFANERLARHYGLKGVAGTDFQRVSLAGTRRRGLLTQASFLAVTSNPTRTSPVKRGKFILENFLASPPPPPPANVPLLDEGGKKLTGTLRQRLEEHRSNPSCAACHRLMDPLGFALEHFDAVGRWRENDGGEPIDSSGRLPSGEEFEGSQELTQVLLASRRDQFVRCLIEKSMVYALGRGIEYYDQCAIDKIARRLEQDDFRFSRLIIEIVRSDPFRKRAGKRSL